MKHDTAVERAGWRVSDYAAACGFSKATYYNLPENLRPRSIRLGGRRIVIEQPSVYLDRLARAHAQPGAA